MTTITATPIVFVVDDDLTVRESLESLIGTSGWRAETFASAREFLARPQASVPSCLVLDVALPDFSGLDLQKRVAVDRPEMPVIFITGCGDISMSVQAMKAGAVEFLTKPFRNEALLDAIRHALGRSRRALEHDATLKTFHDSYASLSPREREVMVLVVSGLLNKQVAGELGISEITGEGAPGPGDAKDEGRLAASARQHGRVAGPPDEPAGVSASPRRLHESTLLVSLVGIMSLHFRQR